jgi:hypothetical protein
MNPVRWKYLAAVMFTISLVFLSSIFLLPLVKSPQRAVYNGPATSFGGEGTSISGYYIPTIDSGAKVVVYIENFIPGAIDVSIFPSQAGAISPIPGESPVYLKSPLINETASFTASDTQPYGIYVISRNSSRFTLIVQATYSPYYWLSGYSSVTIALTFGTAVLFYYYNFTAKRWRLEQKAIKEARGEDDDGGR